MRLGHRPQKYEDHHSIPRKDHTMTTNTNTIPVGQAVLGRVLNANGEPLDHKGDLDQATHQPLYTPDVLSTTASTVPRRLLETGIKAIDLMAPVAHGSIIGMIAGFAMGKDVIMEEIMHNLITRHQAVIVIAGMSKTTYETSTLREMIRDIEAEDHVIMLFEPTTDQLPLGQKLLHAAMTIAAHFSDAGQEILLILDEHLITLKNIADVQQFASVKGIAIIRFAPSAEAVPLDKNTLDMLDTQFWFSQARAKQNLWPALDPLASRSSLLDSDVVSAEHQLVASRVRDVLQHYYNLREHIGSETLSEEDQCLLARGEKIDLFFTQPFTVAEAYTDIPGTYLTIEETVSSFRDLLDGRYDAMSTQAFRFIGKIEQI
jgi:F0F1-type ATP synthase beta subunit